MYKENFKNSVCELSNIDSCNILFKFFCSYILLLLRIVGILGRIPEKHCLHFLFHFSTTYWMSAASQKRYPLKYFQVKISWRQVRKVWKVLHCSLLANCSAKNKWKAGTIVVKEKSIIVSSFFFSNVPFWSHPRDDKDTNVHFYVCFLNLKNRYCDKQEKILT